MKTQERSKLIIKIDSTQRFNKKIELLKLTDGNSVLVDEVTGDFDLVVEIRKMLKRNSLEPSDIDEYVPNIGPGPSFTGIKTGVTIANVLNWANNKRGIKESFIPEYGAEPNIQDK